MTREEAIDKIKAWDFLNDLNDNEKEVLEILIPELQESEDEKIRKWIIDDIKYNMDNEPLNSSEYKKKAEDAIAWLEKQGEQKPTNSYCQENCKGYQETGKCFADWDCEDKREAESINKAEPKFKAGDWIVKGNVVYHIDKISGVYLTLSTLNGTALVYHTSVLDNDKIRLWTLDEAKDGDVLVTFDDKRPFLYKGCSDPNYPDSPVAYCGIDTQGYLCSGGYNHWWTDEEVQPATKEQRELLFQKMAEEGYKWSAEKKELKKIEQESQRMISAEAKEALYDKLTWSEADESALNGIIDEIEANRSEAPDYGIKVYDKYLNWLKSLKQRLEE